MAMLRKAELKSEFLAIFVMGFYEK